MDESQYSDDTCTIGTIERSLPDSAAQQNSHIIGAESARNTMPQYCIPHTLRENSASPI